MKSGRRDVMSHPASTIQLECKKLQEGEDIAKRVLAPIQVDHRLDKRDDGQKYFGPEFLRRTCIRHICATSCLKIKVLKMIEPRTGGAFDLFNILKLWYSSRRLDGGHSHGIQ